MLTPEKLRAVELFAEGRRFYKLMEFEKAIQKFSEALASDPHDGPSQVYLDRCRHYLTNPPPEDWDGVFVMKTK